MYLQTVEDENDKDAQVVALKLVNVTDDSSTKLICRSRRVELCGLDKFSPPVKKLNVVILQYLNVEN